MEIPEGHYGRIAPRSSLAARCGIDVMAGVIDCDYRAEVAVILINHGEAVVLITAGSRIAQLILERISTPPTRIVQTLSVTERGAGGFGSTGV